MRTLLETQNLTLFSTPCPFNLHSICSKRHILLNKCDFRFLSLTNLTKYTCAFLHVEAKKCRFEPPIEQFAKNMHFVQNIKYKIEIPRLK